MIMPSDKLHWLDGLPDLVLVVRRDGTLLSHVGGQSVAALVPNGDAEGRQVAQWWPPDAAALLMQLCRKAIASRLFAESWFTLGELRLEIRATPLGADRLVCVIRPAVVREHDDETVSGSVPDSTAHETSPHLDRRRFMPQLHEALALASLKERSAALLVFELCGIDDISGIDARLAKTMMKRIVMRLRSSSFLPGAAGTDVGALGDSHLAVLLNTGDRVEIDEFASRLRASVQETVRVGSEDLQVDCFAGVSLLGRDATTAKELLNQAKIAAGEARRAAATRAYFFSDTMRLRPIARLDIARELQAAVRGQGLSMRYLGRHDLETGVLDALVGYVAWRHPMRGEVPPKEFLGVAAATGGTLSLSREMLRMFGCDVKRMISETAVTARFSFGPLRHHLLHEDFITDIEQFLDKGGISAERMEVRVDERSFAAIAPRIFESLHALKVRVTVDEVGRSLGSFTKLAGLPLWGMQLDRTFVEDLSSSVFASRLCRAGISVADALGLASIATGVDDETTRRLLREAGCRYGCGDIYGGARLAEISAG